MPRVHHVKNFNDYQEKIKDALVSSEAARGGHACSWMWLAGPQRMGCHGRNHGPEHEHAQRARGAACGLKMVLQTCMHNVAQLQVVIDFTASWCGPW